MPRLLEKGPFDLALEKHADSQHLGVEQKRLKPRAGPIQVIVLSAPGYIGLKKRASPFHAFPWARMRQALLALLSKPSCSWPRAKHRNGERVPLLLKTLSPTHSAFYMNRKHPGPSQGHSMQTRVARVGLAWSIALPRMKTEA